MRIVVSAVAFLSIAATVPTASQDQETRSLKDAIGDNLVDASWIYDDIDKGTARALQSGRPLLVSFR